jgi:hypothetical protein
MIVGIIINILNILKNLNCFWDISFSVIINILSVIVSTGIGILAYNISKKAYKTSELQRRQSYSKHYIKSYKKLSKCLGDLDAFYNCIVFDNSCIEKFRKKTFETYKKVKEVEFEAKLLLNDEISDYAMEISQKLNIFLKDIAINSGLNDTQKKKNYSNLHNYIEKQIHLSEKSEGTKKSYIVLKYRKFINVQL